MVDGVLSVEQGDYMPYENREHELNTILNSVSEGIVAVDKEGKITHINEVACCLFHSTREEVLGMDVGDIFSTNTPIYETLRTGLSYRLKEQKIYRKSKIIRFS